MQPGDLTPEWFGTVLAGRYFGGRVHTDRRRHSGLNLRCELLGDGVTTDSTICSLPANVGATR